MRSGERLPFVTAPHCQPYSFLHLLLTRLLFWHLDSVNHTASPLTPYALLGVWAVGEGCRIRCPFRSGGYSRIVRREGWVRPLWIVLLIEEGRMSYRLCTSRAFVAGDERVIDGKSRRAHRSHQQRRGGEHGHCSLYSTQHTLLALYLPSDSAYAPQGRMVRLKSWCKATPARRHESRG